MNIFFSLFYFSPFLLTLLAQAQEVCAGPARVEYPCYFLFTQQLIL